jgi:DUF2939 family protein
MKTMVNLLVAVIIAGSTAWLYASPQMVVRDLQAAAEQGDSAALSKHVDFPAVRENLKADVKEAMMGGSKEDSDDALSGLGLAVGGTIVDGAVDTFVSPSGVAAISRGIHPSGKSSDDQAPSFKIKTRRLNSFMVEFENSDNAPDLVFSRKGLGWQLTRIDLAGIMSR